MSFTVLIFHYDETFVLLVYLISIIFDEYYRVYLQTLLFIFTYLKSIKISIKVCYMYFLLYSEQFD